MQKLDPQMGSGSAKHTPSAFVNPEPQAQAGQPIEGINKSITDQLKLIPQKGQSYGDRAREEAADKIPVIGGFLKKKDSFDILEANEVNTMMAELRERLKGMSSNAKIAFSQKFADLNDRDLALADIAKMTVFARSQTANDGNNYLSTTINNIDIGKVRTNSKSDVQNKAGESLIAAGDSRSLKQDAALLYAAAKTDADKKDPRTNK